MTITSETIIGRVNPALLQKADRLFRNDDAGVWTEVLQNSRRAGATLVEISIEQATANNCVITVQDDGHGILDFQELLTLGSSGWDEQTEAREDPAGMGFFSLCHSVVEVRSGTRYVNLSPAVFLGKEQATVEELSTPVHGTQIRFTRPSNKEAITAALRRAAEFYPVEVRLGSESLQRHDFLDGALYREIIDGIEVGFAPDFEWCFSPYHDDNWNFYGARIEQCELKISGVLLKDPPFPKTLCARFNAARYRTSQATVAR